MRREEDTIAGLVVAAVRFVDALDRDASGGDAIAAAFASGITIVSSGETRQSIFCALGAEHVEDLDAFDQVVDLATGRDRGPR